MFFSLLLGYLRANLTKSETNKKKYRYMWFTHRCVESANALHARACDTSWHRIITFHHVIRSTTVSSFYWLDMCWLWYGDLLLVCFCFLLFGFFFVFLLNWFFFSISPSNKKLICISNFNFDPHSFYFFVLLLNWFFLSISPFNQK